MAEDEYSKQFWAKWKETRLDEIARLSRKRLRAFYDFFADQHLELHPKYHDALYRAAIERMESIQRELDRRSSFWATLIGFATLAVSGVAAATGIVKCSDDRLLAIRENTVPPAAQSTPTPTPAQTPNTATPIETPVASPPQSPPGQSPTSSPEPR